MEEKQNSAALSKKGKLAVLLCLLLALAASAVTVWVVFFRQAEGVLAPDYAPQETEKHAQTVSGEGEEKFESEKGGGGVSLEYSDQVSVDLSEQTAALLFTNPHRSNQNMLIQIVVQEKVLVQSGILPPGYRVMTLDLLDGASDLLSVGGYDGTFLIYYYSPESGEKAMINTEIPIHIEVKE